MRRFKESNFDLNQLDDQSFAKSRLMRIERCLRYGIEQILLVWSSFWHIHRPGADQPKQQSERERNCADTDQLLERCCREIEKNDFSRDNQDCYQHYRPRLQNA